MKSSQREAEKKLEEVRDKANQAEVVGAKLTSKTKECEELWETNKVGFPSSRRVSLTRAELDFE